MMTETDSTEHVGQCGSPMACPNSLFERALP